VFFSVFRQTVFLVEFLQLLPPDGAGAGAAGAQNLGQSLRHVQPAEQGTLDVRQQDEEIRQVGPRM